MAIPIRFNNYYIFVWQLRQPIGQRSQTVISECWQLLNFDVPSYSPKLISSIVKYGLGIFIEY